MDVDPRAVRVPRARWGGRWRRELDLLGEVPDDGEWHELAEYGKTTGYQVARELNLAASLPLEGELEFGTVDGPDGSQLVVRRVVAAA